MIVVGRLVVAGDAAATAANLVAHERLYWLGLASCLVGVLFHVAWAALFYDLFKVVNRGVARFATFVILVGCAVQAVAAVLYLAPWLVLHGGGSLGSFTAEQRQGLALWLFGWNDYTFEVYLVFFGFWCLLIGWLIFRSTFLPRILGAADDRRHCLDDLSLATARAATLPVHRRGVRPLGDSAGVVAPRFRNERAEVGGGDGARRRIVTACSETLALLALAAGCREGLVGPGRKHGRTGPRASAARTPAWSQ